MKPYLVDFCLGDRVKFQTKSMQDTEGDVVYIGSPDAILPLTWRDGCGWRSEADLDEYLQARRDKRGGRWQGAPAGGVVVRAERNGKVHFYAPYPSQVDVVR